MAKAAPSALVENQRRLGHRETRADLAVDQRLQPARLLVGAAAVQQQLNVARVGRLAIAGPMSQWAAAQLFGHVSKLDQRHAEAAEVARHLRCPEAGVLGNRTQRLELGQGALETELGDELLARQDFVAYKGVVAVLERLDAFGNRKIHGGLSFRRV